MPRPKPKRERLREVWEWLVEAFPVRRSAALVIRRLDSDHCGYVVEYGRRITVYIDDRLPIYSMIDTLLHEWSHVKSRRQGHGIEFLWTQAEIEREFWRWKTASTSKYPRAGASSAKTP